MCHCHLQTAVEINSVSEVEGKNEDTSSSITDMPLSLTNCSGDRKSVFVKLMERMTTPVVQRHALLMCHYHLLSAVVEINKVC